MKAITNTDFSFPGQVSKYTGKVRDVYDLGDSLLFVATDRDKPAEETKFDFFDVQWQHLDIRNGHPNAAVPPVRPAHFEEMLRLSQTLAGDFPQVRIDFYETPDGRVLFGEYTFYHWSGFVPFEPDEADERLGRFMADKWTK
mgnify:CR=1 FL=1